jgi:hypothetical protein
MEKSRKSQNYTCVSSKLNKDVSALTTFFSIVTLSLFLVGRWSGLASYESFLAKVDQYRLEEGGYIVMQCCGSGSGARCLFDP